MFSSIIQYEFTKPWTVQFGELWNKQIAAGTYTRQELIDLVEGQIEVTQFDEEKISNNQTLVS